MASQDYLPKEDQALNAWLQTFNNVCNINKTELGLSNADLTAIGNAYGQFSDDMVALDSAKSAYQGIVTGKNKTKSGSTTVVRTFARKFKANPAVSEATLRSLGIVANNSVTPVVPVTNLVVTGCDDGVNKLKFDRATNSQGTMFIIEYREEGQSDWKFAASITRTTFNHEDQTPGQKQYYRVISTRAGKSSTPCPPAVVYGNNEETTLTIAA
jgi:hypothetical protein